MKFHLEHGTAGFLTVTAVLASTRPCAQAAQQPNILFIMSDDHAINAISAYGSRLNEVFSTPRIDRLAIEGVRMNNTFCTNSLCSPSRASILTGQYSHVHGVYTLFEPFDRERPNLAKELQAAGYQTAVIGKWHLHTEPSGFDFYQVLRGQGPYFDPPFFETGLDEEEPVFYQREGRRIQGYTTDIITDLSIDWLENRDPSRPFMLKVHHKAPHAPFQYASRHEDAFKGVVIPEPESLWEDQTHRSVGSRGLGFFIERFVERAEAEDYPTGQLDTTGMTAEQKRQAGYQKYLKDYLRTVMAIDESVGRLTDYIDQHGLAENTIIIYTSDQGMFLGEHNYIDKRWVFEESLRMPFIIRYPGVLGPGTTTEAICLNIDFAPTLLDFAGLETPDYMQGISFRRVLEGDVPDDWRESMYYRYWLQTSRPAHFAVRTDRYKLIFFYGQTLGKSLEVSWDIVENSWVGWELYDLKKDPYELQNQYGNPEYANEVRVLKKELLRLREKYGDLDKDYPIMQEILEGYWN